MRVAHALSDRIGWFSLDLTALAHDVAVARRPNCRPASCSLNDARVEVSRFESPQLSHVLHGVRACYASTARGISPHPSLQKRGFGTQKAPPGVPLRPTAPSPKRPCDEGRPGHMCSGSASLTAVPRPAPARLARTSCLLPPRIGSCPSRPVPSSMACCCRAC